MRQEKVNKTFVLATLGMLSAIFAASTAVAYPKIMKVMKIRDEIRAAELEFELSKKAASSVDAYHEAEMPVITAALAEYDNKLPRGERVPELIAAVKRACKAAGVTDVSIATQKAGQFRLKDSRLTRCTEGSLHRLPVALTGTATYRGLAALLNNLAAGRRLILVDSITIKGADHRPGLISFRAQVEGYCFLETARRK